MSPIFEPVENPTRKGQDAKGSKTGPPIRDGSSSQQELKSPLITSKIYGRRKPPRTKGRKKKEALKKKAAKLCQEKEAAEAAEATERARVAAEKTTRKAKEEEEGRLKRGCRRVPKGEMIQPQMGTECQ